MLRAPTIPETLLSVTLASTQGAAATVVDGGATGAVIAVRGSGSEPVTTAATA